MKAIFGLILGGACLAASGLAADPLRKLGETELDAVTAGGANALAAAIGTGDAALTTASTKVAGLRDDSSRSDRDDVGATVYAAGATASGFSVDGVIATGASATTSANGPDPRTTTVGWSVSVLGVAISSSFSHTASNDRGRILGP